MIRPIPAIWVLQDLGAADPGSCRIGGMIFDTEGNLWVSNYAASNPLVVRKADGSLDAL